MREHNRYLRGMSAWVGFDQTGVTYARDPRRAGETKYSFGKMIRFGLTGIVSFSTAPLRLALNLGFRGVSARVPHRPRSHRGQDFGIFAVPGWASIVS